MSPSVLGSGTAHPVGVLIRDAGDRRQQPLFPLPGPSGQHLQGLPQATSPPTPAPAGSQSWGVGRGPGPREDIGYKKGLGWGCRSCLFTFPPLLFTLRTPTSVLLCGGLGSVVPGASPYKAAIYQLMPRPRIYHPRSTSVQVSPKIPKRKGAQPLPPSSHQVEGGEWACAQRTPIFHGQCSKGRLAWGYGSPEEGGHLALRLGWLPFSRTLKDKKDEEDQRRRGSTSVDCKVQRPWGACDR